MSDSKSNLALGVSSVALVAAGASFVYTNSQVSPLEERITSLEEDMASIASILHESKSAHTSEMARAKQGIKALGKRIDKLDRKFGDNDELHDEVMNIKEKINVLIEHLELPAERVKIAPLPDKKEKPTKHKKKKQKSAESDEDSADIGDYIASLKRK